MNRIKSCKSYTKIVACFPIGGGYPEMAMDPQVSQVELGAEWLGMTNCGTFLQLCQ